MEASCAIVLRAEAPEMAPVRTWAERLAARRGRRVAVAARLQERLQERDERALHVGRSSILGIPRKNATARAETVRFSGPRGFRPTLSAPAPAGCGKRPPLPDRLTKIAIA